MSVELSGFSLWMEGQDLSPASRSSYESAVRSALKDGVRPGGDLEPHLSSYAPSSGALRRRAWDLFCQFTEETDFDITERPNAGTFERWLMDERYLAASTAEQYGRAIARMLQQGVRWSEAVDLAAYIETLNARARTLLTSALAHFPDYCVLQQWPVPARIGSTGLPEHVLLAVDLLSEDRNIPPDEFAGLRWADIVRPVSTRRDNALVYAIKIKGRTITCAGACGQALETLRLWGQPSAADRPVLPRQPGSVEPLPAAAYRAIRRDAKKALEQIEGLYLPVKEKPPKREKKTREETSEPTVELNGKTFTPSTNVISSIDGKVGLVRLAQIMEREGIDLMGAAQYVEANDLEIFG